MDVTPPVVETAIMIVSLKSMRHRDRTLWSIVAFEVFETKSGRKGSGEETNP